MGVIRWHFKRIATGVGIDHYIGGECGIGYNS